MYQNSCCPPPTHKKDDCCCKDGMLCALDWFYQDFLVKPTGNNCIEPGTLKYYPILPELPGPIAISNTIYNIPYITPDIVPVYIENLGEPYDGDITYLNICKLHGFEFELKDAACETIKEADITSKFSKIRYTSSNGCCCKNGTLEYLLKARDFLLNPPATNLVILSTPANSFAVTQILAINSDAIWAKNVVTTPSAKTTYYVLSLCEIIGITLDKA